MKDILLIDNLCNAITLHFIVLLVILLYDNLLNVILLNVVLPMDNVLNVILLMSFCRLSSF